MKLLLATFFSAIFFSAFVVTKWNIIADKASVNFELVNEGASGSFSGLNADISFDENNLGAAKIRASVDAKTINTGNEKRDAHLRNADFFDVEKYPLIKFVSDKISKSEKGFVATGKLFMKDSVKTVEIPFDFVRTGDEASFKGTFIFFASDYGVMKKDANGKDKIQVTLNVPVALAR